MDTAKAEILAGLQRGERLTVLNMIIRFHVTSGQQRLNELRREGHPIDFEWTKLPTGKRIKTYYWNPAGGSIPSARATERPSSVPPAAVSLDRTL